MLGLEEILEIIYKNILELDDEDVINAFNKCENKKDFPLIGLKTLLDSMDLVTLIISVEAEINKINPSIKIASDDAMAERLSPFRSPQTISDYIMK
tara:strand:+ start:889 stop:1176 length:288 start_codon:yes stop_codon:yes gene_type:complete